MYLKMKNKEQTRREEDVEVAQTRHALSIGVVSTSTLSASQSHRLSKLQRYTQQRLTKSQFKEAGLTLLKAEEFAVNLQHFYASKSMRVNITLQPQMPQMIRMLLMV